MMMVQRMLVVRAMLTAPRAVPERYAATALFVRSLKPVTMDSPTLAVAVMPIAQGLERVPPVVMAKRALNSKLAMMVLPTLAELVTLIVPARALVLLVVMARHAQNSKLAMMAMPMLVAPVT